jgi:glycine cleavage system H protein
LADFETPGDLRYSREDEWARSEDDRVVIGITDYAQQQLGDIVFVELPEVGARFGRGEPFGVVESVKAVSELYAPLGGEVVAVNDDLTDGPEAVNESCYGEGWMIALRPGNGGEQDDLLTADEYRKYVAERSD